MKFKVEKYKCLFILLLTIQPVISNALPRLPLVENSKSRYVIIIPKNASASENKAAVELQRLLKACSQAYLPILKDHNKSVDYEIIIGASTHLAQQSIAVDFNALKEDGYAIRTHKNIVVIAGGTGKGALYGVYEFLEKYVGFRCYTPDDFFIPKKKNISLPVIKNEISVPVIDFRTLHYRNDSDNDFYRDWHKLTHHRTEGRMPGWGNLWVHTFTYLLPQAEYYKTHPEYFSLVDGKRLPLQPCLTNPAVLELMVDNLKKQMDMEPDARYWSVSQNDNTSFCTCPNCKAINEKEKSNSGTIINFVNAVAARFPDKIISTLAYQYSRKAPAHIKPSKNVNIMFCSIECNRALPIAIDSSSASFRKDMEDWSKLTNNLLVWDYVVQFKNLVSPFPNLFVLQPNIQYFVKNRARQMFQQGNREKGGEFAALRQYLIAKLLWNPNINLNATMNDFLKGYYGTAWQNIRQYIDFQQKELLKSGKRLEIAGDPEDHAANGFLRKEMTDTYTNLFDKAEQLVKDDSTILLHVKEARMPLEYALLKIGAAGAFTNRGFFKNANSGSQIVKKEAVSRLENFYKLCKSTGVTKLREWDTTPDEFYAIMQRSMNNDLMSNLAYKKQVKYATSFHESYPGGGEKALTDAIYGSYDIYKNWQGFALIDMDATIDLGALKSIQKTNASFLQLSSSWIFLPDKVTFYTSCDGINFEVLEEINNTVSERESLLIKKFESNKKIKARYIRVAAKNKAFCPDWHEGAGRPCWMFIDEIAAW